MAAVSQRDSYVSLFDQWGKVRHGVYLESTEQTPILPLSGLLENAGSDERPLGERQHSAVVWFTRLGNRLNVSFTDSLQTVLQTLEQAAQARQLTPAERQVMQGVKKQWNHLLAELNQRLMVNRSGFAQRLMRQALAQFEREASYATLHRHPLLQRHLTGADRDALAHPTAKPLWWLAWPHAARSQLLDRAAHAARRTVSAAVPLPHAAQAEWSARVHALALAAVDWARGEGTRLKREAHRHGAATIEEVIAAPGWELLANPHYLHWVFGHAVDRWIQHHLPAHPVAVARQRAGFPVTAWPLDVPAWLHRAAEGKPPDFYENNAQWPAAKAPSPATAKFVTTVLDALGFTLLAQWAHADQAYRALPPAPPPAPPHLNTLLSSAQFATAQASWTQAQWNNALPEMWRPWTEKWNRVTAEATRRVLAAAEANRKTVVHREVRRLLDLRRRESREWLYVMTRAPVSDFNERLDALRARATGPREAALPEGPVAQPPAAGADAQEAPPPVGAAQVPYCHRQQAWDATVLSQWFKHYDRPLAKNLPSSEEHYFPSVNLRYGRVFLLGESNDKGMFRVF
jgi:hypothetical protein